MYVMKMKIKNIMLHWSFVLYYQDFGSVPILYQTPLMSCRFELYYRFWRLARTTITIIIYMNVANITGRVLMNSKCIHTIEIEAF